MLVPPALRPGDLVDVVAPSSPFDRTLAWRGLGWLRQRYEVRFDPGVFETSGYLAGSDERRFIELDRAFRCPNSRAIVAVRGGYGLNRIAHRLPWEVFRTQAKWLVGFSDVTALHVEAAANDVASIHGPMVAMLGRGHAPTREAWVDALENPLRIRTWSNLRALSRGQATGRSFGGNLAMLHACAAASRLRVPRDAVLFIEDVGERPYRVDRMLTTLSVGGHFDHIRGVVLGEFIDCAPGLDGIGIEDVVREAFEALRIPVVTGFPIGHGLDNEPLHLGARVDLNADSDQAQLLLRW